MFEVMEKKAQMGVSTKMTLIGVGVLGLWAVVRYVFRLV